MGSKFSAKGPLASRLVCADCDGYFGAKVWHSNDPYKTVIWRCNDKYKPTTKRVSGGAKCMTGHVTEEQVYGAFGEIVNKLIVQRPEVVAACEEVLAELTDTGDLDAKMERLTTEQKRITERVEALMNRASREVVANSTDAYGRLEVSMATVQAKLDAVEQEKAERGYKERQCRLFLKTVQGLSNDGAVESLADSDLFLALMDKVVMGDEMRFVLGDGTKWKV